MSAIVDFRAMASTTDHRDAGMLELTEQCTDVMQQQRRLYDLYNPKASGPAVNISPSAPSPGGSSDTPPPSGSATITVRHVNPPPGSVVTAQTSGTIFNGAPKIETSLPGVGGGME